MTHEKLLAKIDPYGMDDYGDFKTQYGEALRAVVELCEKYRNDYYVGPFTELVIQAIEKELE